MGKQEWLEGVPKRPTKAELKAFVRAKLEGFEVRQAERARRRAEARSAKSGAAREAAVQQILPLDALPASPKSR